MNDNSWYTYYPRRVCGTERSCTVDFLFMDLTVGVFRIFDTYQREVAQSDQIMVLQGIPLPLMICSVQEIKGMARLFVHPVNSTDAARWVILHTV